ncbi:MAG: acyltransferase, partial [Acidisphaera sp.]|nr:acyltransferase [Acidisphaera sp.]
MRAESNRVMGGGPVAGRLIFANQLRGLAALSVAFSHLVGVFWLMRSFVGLATFSPVQPGSPPKLVDMVSAAWFQPGPFGVAVFFLISGLVLPISLGQHSRSSFLLARLLRIYPTYLLALVIEVAVLHAAAVYWNTPFGYGNWTIAANGLLIHDLLDLPSVDLVNWTLCVELKFYLLLALLAPRIRRGDVSCLFVIALAVVASNSAFSWLRIDATPLAQMLSTESVCIVFMLLGVLFNFRLRRLLSERSFLIAIFAMFALFVAAWRNGPVGNQFPLVTVNYAYALALFAILYGLRRYVREGRFLNFAAAISFPLYLVHSIIGFVVMKLLML